MAYLGCFVVIAEINNNGVLVEKEIKDSGGNALFVRTDLSKSSDLLNLAKIVEQKVGIVDILVNNAAATPFGSVIDTTLEQWDKSYQVNVRSVVELIKIYLPEMLKRKSGVISLVATSDTISFASAYSSIKSATQSLGLILADEIGPESGVSVFVFGPGMVDTPGIRDALENLVPLYGMTKEEFIKLGSNSGYEGLMPAFDCAASFAYCIINARKFHGQVADSLLPLIQNSIINIASPEAKTTTENVEIEELKMRSATKTSDSLENDLLNLKIVLSDLIKESEELNMFKRKWIERTFKKRTGMSQEEWYNIIDSLIADLKVQKISVLTEKTNLVKLMLPKLIYNFEENKKDANSYLKDKDLLSKAIKELDKRIDMVNQVKNSLEILTISQF